MGGPTALLSRCLGSMDLLQGMGSAAAIGARGAHLAARDDPEKAPIGFLSFAGADSGKRHPDPICQWYSNVLCTSLLVLPLVAKEQRLGTSVHVLLSKLWRIISITLCPSHTPQRLTQSLTLPTTPEFQEKTGNRHHERTGSYVAWHAFTLQSPHRMNSFPPEPAKEKKKVWTRNPGGTAHISKKQVNPPRTHSGLNTATKISSKQRDIQWLDSQSLGLDFPMLALLRATQISKTCGEAVHAGICLEDSC